MLEAFILAFIVTLGNGISDEREVEALALHVPMNEVVRDLEFYMHVGGQVNASDAPSGGVGLIMFDGKLDLGVTFMGPGKTKWGKVDPARVFTATRIVTPGWYDSRFFIGVGYANVQHTLLVGEHNFNLLMGLQYNWGRVYLQHISDLGIGSNNNTGLDFINIGLYLTF